MWTLNVSSPPWVCVSFCECSPLCCWSGGSSSLLTNSGWLQRLIVKVAVTFQTKYQMLNPFDEFIEITVFKLIGLTNPSPSGRWKTVNDGEKIWREEFEGHDRQTSTWQGVSGKEDPDQVWEEGMLLCYTVAWGTITWSLENCHGCQIEGVRPLERTRVHSDVVTPTQFAQSL